MDRPPVTGRPGGSKAGRGRPCPRSVIFRKVGAAHAHFRGMVGGAHLTNGRSESAAARDPPDRRHAWKIGTTAGSPDGGLGPMRTAPKIIAVLALMPGTHAQEARKGDWRPLFDGKGLDGWQHVGPGKMVVEDGLIRTEGGMGLLWYAREKLGNCSIRIVYKTTARRSNSGVFIRIADKPEDPWYAVHHGYEVQIADAGDEYHRTGSLYSMSKATARPSQVGQWNTMEITLQGQRVRVTLNGVQVQDFNPETAQIPARTKVYEPE